MSYEITYDENISNDVQQKIIVVNGKHIYKIYLRKEACRKNGETGVDYTLDIKCVGTSVNIKANLPHEVMNVLGDMINDSLKF